MLAEMTSAQVTEWAAYAAVEPFGEERSDYRMAYALAVIVNMFQGKDGTPVKPTDLLPKVGVLADEDAGWGEQGNLPPVHPNVRRFEELMEHLQWAQSQA